MSYKYVVNTGNLKEFLQKMKSKHIGLPDKINSDFLKSVGYKSGNDYAMVTLLKSIGFIDANNSPTQPFKDFRTEKSGQVMASALKNTYAELFTIYPEPHKKSNEELENFFAKGKPELKKSTLKCYIDTFRVLAEFGDFGAAQYKETVTEEAEEFEEKVKKKLQVPEGFTINLNIQITLPVTDDAKVYENIFKALKEHIFKRD
jgi:hypothetical protein